MTYKDDTRAEGIKASIFHKQNTIIDQYIVSRNLVSNTPGTCT